MSDNTINNDVTMGGVSAALLAGRYRVVRLLGQGGMGSVWLAEDTKLDGHKVAIKMLPSILVNNRRAYALVKAEALVSLKLSHPNIVTVRAFEEEGGSPFLVMDYIDGQTLDDYLAEKGKLTEEETIRLLKPVAAALDYAHTQGVVHRDVKPGNVMIDKSGHPYVLDFGIAREIQETMTRVTGKLSSGTLMYMSPEQLHGAAPKPAQDVYSFAAMAYECLKGAPPFSRGQIEYQIEHDTPGPLGPLFIKCGLGVMAGLEKTPGARPATCAAVLSVRARVPRDRMSAGTPVNKVRDWVAGMALVLVVLGGVGGWLWYERTKSDGLSAGRIRQIHHESNNGGGVKGGGQTMSPPDNVDLSGTCKTMDKTNAMRTVFVPYKGPTKEYVVGLGDTLGGIAYRNGITICQLKAMNGLSDDLLKIGQRLVIPTVRMPCCDVVILIDASGSVGRDRFRALSRKVIDGLSTFGSGCRFNLLLFRNTFTAAFSSWREVNDASLKEATTWLKNQTVHGRTDLMGALDGVLGLDLSRDRKTYALVLTDVSDDLTDAMLARVDRFTYANAGRVRLYAYGISLLANRQLLENLTSRNHGELFISQSYYRGNGFENLAKAFERIVKDCNR